ncbi:pantoate--beta-alanine ligase [Devosia chinhatensis]|uniref:Uncharacterized protein n=1 Tax=Devosia chinhatensis TaxID=429727 RepID=A0A0F5FEA8_9HYPH|nr:pantoate--beta-alanine ligase [Devosia chinhatensis]KKB06925.1 hypothetical protein VE26_16815 [Devosia chinhatensis]
MTIILRDKAARQAWRQALGTGARLVFVPTMGALNAVHVRLMALARDRADLGIASILVHVLSLFPISLP